MTSSPKFKINSSQIQLFIFKIPIITRRFGTSDVILVLYVILYINYTWEVGRDSVVGIETGYGLAGLGIESRWGRDFLQPSRLALGPTQPPIQCAPGLFRA
jgi:hypothetical protein